MVCITIIKKNLKCSLFYSNLDRMDSILDLDGMDTDDIHVDGGHQIFFLPSDTQFHYHSHLASVEASIPFLGLLFAHSVMFLLCMYL